MLRRCAFAHFTQSPILSRNRTTTGLSPNTAVEFVREQNFRADLLAVRSYEYVLLVDDNVFVRDFSLADVIADLRAQPDAIGFSLRLGRNTTYCYPLDKPQPIPEFETLGSGALKFNWTTAELDFNYPLEVSSSVYCVSDVLSVLKGLDFGNPNALEAQLAVCARGFQCNRSALLCFRQSVTFCQQG